MFLSYFGTSSVYESIFKFVCFWKYRSKLVVILQAYGILLRAEQMEETHTHTQQNISKNKQIMGESNIFTMELAHTHKLAVPEISDKWMERWRRM